MTDYTCPCGWTTKFRRSMRQHLKLPEHILELARAKKILDYSIWFETTYPDDRKHTLAGKKP